MSYAVLFLCLKAEGCDVGLLDDGSYVPCRVCSWKSCYLASLGSSRMAPAIRWLQQWREDLSLGREKSRREMGITGNSSAIHLNCLALRGIKMRQACPLFSARA